MPPGGGGECVKVVVRCRPLNQRELGMGCKVVVQMEGNRGYCGLTNPSDVNGPPKQFTFDGVYYMDSTTEQMYIDMAYPLVENCLNGYNGTIFAYGQTGSGKSFSMQGPEGIPAQKGIIPRAFEHIFDATATTENVKFLVHASYLEIYNEDVRDLLGNNQKSKLEIKEHPEKGIYVNGLSMHTVHNAKECEGVMEKGLKNRHTGATLMNADSSRSHSIFSISIEMMTVRADGEHIKTAKLHLVDLAGSERQAKTGATGDRLKEATKINLSLSALGNVISALVDGKAKHIPYRDSKLTRLLQDSLGGNTKTIMIACLSPADNNYEETLSTLRYANRAKNIKNKPKINEDPKDALLREYQEEIARLKAQLSGTGPQATLDPKAIEEEKAKLRQEYEEQMAQLQQQYKSEQTTKAKLQEDLGKLQKSYETAVQEIQQGRKVNVQAELVDRLSKKGLMAPSSSPTGGDVPGMDPSETLKRLQMLEHQMVGGEQANNEQLKAKRRKQQDLAAKKSQQLAEALSKFDIDDDEAIVKVFSNVQEKLEATTKLVEKEKKKVKLLEKEIQDLSGEFELDRADYLDTIRRQDQQVKLMQQIMDKMQPCMRRDSNYANVDKIRKDAVWDEDLQKWILPEVTVVKTQLPATGGGATGGIMPGGRSPGQPGLHSREVKGYAGLMDDGEEDKLRLKLQQSEAENLANNYFKPVQSNRLINNGHKDNREVSSHFPNNKNTWDNLMSGVIYTNDIYERPSGGGSQSAPQSTTNVAKNVKPNRLESLENKTSTAQSARPRNRGKPTDVTF